MHAFIVLLHYYGPLKRFLGCLSLLSYLPSALQKRSAPRVERQVVDSHCLSFLDHQWAWSMKMSLLYTCVGYYVIKADFNPSGATGGNICFRIGRFLQDIRSSTYTLLVAILDVRLIFRLDGANWWQ